MTTQPADQQYLDRLLSLGPDLPPRLRRLIAAAPEMLAFVQELVAQFDGDTEVTEIMDEWIDRRARALLARLDGKE